MMSEPVSEFYDAMFMIALFFTITVAKKKSIFVRFIIFCIYVNEYLLSSLH